MLLIACFGASCHGATVGPLSLGSDVRVGEVAKHFHSQSDHVGQAFWSDVPVVYLDSSVTAHVRVTELAYIQTIEIQMPLAKLGDVKRYIQERFGIQKSDSTSSTARGLAVWDCRDKETAIGLFSKPERGALLLVFTWVPSLSRN
ncbi:hypothetical protein [Dyella sp. 2HG41-7]|uniref:hypothetical protein n=1 Tax=Dyella sp. 2HG41-7 TaxID=2883239 RepID=UPI001F28D6E1|nr:hypothetical protein [Dyella sp. 2HG41-7]